MQTTTTLRPWVYQVRRALVAPGNLIAGAGAVLVSAVTWNPLPLILYGLGEPMWLYRAARSQRYSQLLLDDGQRADREAFQRTVQWRERQLASLLQTTPCGLWVRRGRLPDYGTTYFRLREVRDQAAQIVARRHDAAHELEQDIIARMDDMLLSYLTMVRERMVFHCALAKIYPQLPELPAAEPPPTLLDRMRRLMFRPAAAPPAAAQAWHVDTAFVALDDAISEVRGKLVGFAHETKRNPAHEEVYLPMVEALQRRLDELERRGKNDQVIAAQLRLFPDQFDLILNKLATTQADVSAVVDDMKQLLEQTEDTVQFADDIRDPERPALEPN
jgi:hypothetical protein